MTPSNPSPSAAELELDDDVVARTGMDGAGWFVVILTLALLYGLAISALSGTDSRAERDLVPRPAAAMVVHGEGVAPTAGS